MRTLIISILCVVGVAVYVNAQPTTPPAPPAPPELGWCIEPYFSVSFKTQFAPGYIYGADNLKTQASAFFDPAYFIESVGGSYQPAPEVKTRLGLGLREIITSKFNAYADDPATPEVEKTSVRGGIESVTNVDFKIDDVRDDTRGLPSVPSVCSLDEIFTQHPHLGNRKL